MALWFTILLSNANTFQNESILLIDETLTGFPIPGQSGLGNNDNEKHHFSGGGLNRLQRIQSEYF